MKATLKISPQTQAAGLVVYWYDYPAGRGAYGSGGWSRHARHRPQPVLVTRRPQAIEYSGKSVIVDGLRKLKATIVRESTGEILRQDYELARIQRDL